MYTYEVCLMRDEKSSEELLYKIASLWSAYLGTEVYSDDVELMMFLLEVARKKVYS